MDYKDWIRRRAEDIVFNLFVEPFGKDWDEVWERHKDWAYYVAMEDYKDFYARRMGL